MKWFIQKVAEVLLSLALIPYALAQLYSITGIVSAVDRLYDMPSREYFWLMYIFSRGSFVVIWFVVYYLIFAGAVKLGLMYQENDKWSYDTFSDLVFPSLTSLVSVPVVVACSEFYLRIASHTQAFFLAK